MHLKAKRWNDPVEPDDGTRILVCRYRPRGVRKEDETWQEWWKDLGPTAELHAAFYGKHGPPLTWGEYRRRYLAEMRAQKERIAELARRVQGGEAMTLLCSSACVDPEHCHRTMLARLITEAAEKPKAQPRRKA
ncbi:DUF488 domain-containing protein [Sorangium sp. So ce1078]|uniref:DUF488 domain-containing protein n=1 Tax=Sorangium sp. So ce1078 TaxID=3133329 RepID=UPI003F6257F8